MPVSIWCTRCPPSLIVDMNRSRFYFIEPSKVRTYHITLIEGYLAAILSSAAIINSRDVVFCACESLFDNLSDAVRNRVVHETIPVVDQDKHHVVQKSLLEFWIVLKYMFRMRRNDLMFISCMMPTALLLIEILNRVLRKRNLFVVIHGEIEATLGGEHLHWRSIGYWAVRWLRTRRCDSLIAVVVIDDFIKETLIAKHPDKFMDESIYVAHHPITPCFFDTPEIVDIPTACFIGYRLPAKGFGEFKLLAAAHPNIRFAAIGAGEVEDVRSERARPISGIERFHRAVAECSIAVFPYMSAYDCSLSAAVLDALSTGVHIVATPRASFVSLANDLGSEFVTIYRSTTELEALLDDPSGIARHRFGRNRRLASLASSKFGLAAVQSDFERICGVRSNIVSRASELG